MIHERRQSTTVDNEEANTMTMLRTALEQTRATEHGANLSLAQYAERVQALCGIDPQLSAAAARQMRWAQERERVASRRRRQVALRQWALRLFVCGCFVLPSMPSVISAIARTY